MHGQPHIRFTCINLSDTDTISEHFPIADIANRESIHMSEGQLNSLIHIDWQAYTKQTLRFPFQYIKQPILNDQFITLPSWLPSPRFELWSLAIYTWVINN